MSISTMPPAIQAVGLACVPVHGMPPGELALARRPLAAAVITLNRRDNGHHELLAERMSDVRETEFPLPWLINEALFDGALVIMTAADRAVLAVEAMGRRYMAEPKLASVCAGERTIDPTELPGSMVGDEAALCRRLLIPYPQMNDVDVERVWRRDAPQGAEEIALGIAVARLMMWAHVQSFRAGEPDCFFETLLPLRDWMQEQEKSAPTLFRAVRSRPVARATSFAETYRGYQIARDTGDADARWITFEDGLFHT